MAGLRKPFSTSEFLIPMPHLTDTYMRHENEKKRAYDQRVREVEHATFTPLVFSATGGLGIPANTFYKRLASLMAEKWDHPYSSTLCWLCCCLGFSLLRSSILCIRGARSSRGHAIRTPMPVDLVNQESNIPSILWTFFFAFTVPCALSKLMCFLL